MFFNKKKYDSSSFALTELADGLGKKIKKKERKKLPELYVRNLKLQKNLR